MRDPAEEITNLADVTQETRNKRTFHRQYRNNNADGVIDDQTLYEYDQNHSLNRIDENGEFRASQYNADGKVTQETRNDGYTKSIRYNCP